MLALFWVSVAGIVLAYAGYPLALAAIGRARRRPVRRADATPTVTVVISAFNEEGHIRDTVENKLTLDYPREKLEVLVVSDGSTDSTADQVRAVGDPRARLIVQSPRAGKTAALNRAIPEAVGEIIVFSDANSIYHRQALRRLVANFSDPTVGYVTGKMVYVDEKGSVVGSGCSAYMRYENALRHLETALGSVVGVDGGVDAVRARLYRPMRPDLLPDFVLPLSIVKEGYRVVYEPGALLMEPALDAPADEWKMRIRVTLRSFHALWHMRALFNPFRYGRFAAQLLVHKLLRYWVGFFQIAALAANFALAGDRGFYRVLFALQAAFYASAVAGYLLRDRRQVTGLFKYAYYLCLLNVASMTAFVKFLKGEKQVIWQPRKGS
jgi:cellulose synthase/poly-beta-1,6-N-acetylglucosamine synthase-like glycosyltransferase